MFNTQKDQLFTLIKSLTKAEKRNFKLYTNRFSKGDSKFIQLFDVLDKLTDYDEDQILKKLRGVAKRNLPNLKRHLYKQVLISLRLIYIQKNIDIQIREQLDFARILYGKGLYMQSLKLLERIKRIALEHHQDVLHLEILEFQKMIEARHITRSRTVENKMDNLLKESNLRSSITHATSRLSNFNIQVHGWYIEHGHIGSESERAEVLDFFEREHPDKVSEQQLSFFEKANMYQSYLWLNYILLDLQEGAKFARQWVNLFNIDPQMMEKDPDLYMRSLYYLCTLLYMDGKDQEFQYYLQSLEEFIDSYWDQMNANSRMISFVYYNLSRLNLAFLSRKYAEGLALIPEIKAKIPLYESHTDIHRLLLFYYKFAALHFCKGDHNGALDHLNQIVQLSTSHLREDLHIFARILQIICHYELGNYDVLDYLISSTERQYEKSRDIGQLPGLLLQFLKDLLRAPKYETKEMFAGIEPAIRELAASPYERKAFVFLNPLLWIHSHRKNKPITELSFDEQPDATAYIS
jgi:hypothetical protein